MNIRKISIHIRSLRRYLELIILHVSDLDGLARYNVGGQAKNIFHPWPENIRSAMKTNLELFARYHQRKDSLFLVVVSLCLLNLERR